MDEAEELLADTVTLRRRAQADRRAYWFPLLLFGLATAAAAPLYLERMIPFEGSPGTYYVVVDPRLDEYWTVVLLGGALLTAWWYQRSGRRIGIEGSVGPAVVAAVLLTMVLLVVEALPLQIALWERLPRDFTALLVIAAGLLALAWKERSRELGVIAVLFTVTAVAANAYHVENLLFRLGWDPYAAHPEQVRFTQLPSLLAPAAVLLVGGAVAALRARRSR